MARGFDLRLVLQDTRLRMHFSCEAAKHRRAENYRRRVGLREDDRNAANISKKLHKGNVSSLATCLEYPISENFSDTKRKDVPLMYMP